MSLIVDTNILLRALIVDHEAQSREAQAVLAANDVVIPTQVLSEMVWVLRRLYKRSQTDLIQAVRTWMNSNSVTVDRAAVEAGLAFLEAGGDFADGVIEFEGRRLGGETFVSFDRLAISIAQANGRKGRLLDPK